MKTGLQAGFARVNINPPLGIDINGYWVRRNASGFLDNLEANALALRNGDKTVVLIAVDNVGIANIYYPEFRKKISEETSLPLDAIFLHCTHTHTGPSTMITERDYTAEEIPIYKKLSDDYKDFLLIRCIDVAKLAIADLKSAKMGYGVGKAPNIAFVRRYRMKDGSVKTNPGVLNPDIVEPIGQVDERVSVVRFDREGAETIVLTNMGNHPDTVGGNLISGDWPTLTRHYVEKAIDNTKCIFFNGTQGDVNHVNVHPTKGDFNDMFNDFDGCSRGYGHTKYMARVVTGGVLQAFDKVNYIENDELKFMQKTVQIPANKSETDDLELAEKYLKLHKEGKDEEIPFKAMMLTTVLAESQRIVRMKSAPDNFPFLLSAISIGNVAIIGIPGEPFNAIGRALKQTEGYDLVIPCCIVNGYIGYFPMQDSYDEGGYEARSSSFKAGVGEKIVAYSKELLIDMK